MFHVSSASIHSVPLSQGDEEQSSGGGMTIGKRKCETGTLIAHPRAAHLYRPLRPKPLGTGLVTHSSGSKYNRHAAAVSTQQCHGGCTPYSTNHLQT